MNKKKRVKKFGIKDFLKYISAYLFIGLMGLPAVFSMEETLPLLMIVIVLGCGLCYFISAWCGTRFATKKWGDSVEANGKDYYEITITTNNVEVKEVEGGDITVAGATRVLLFLLYPYWALPFFIIYAIRHKKDRTTTKDYSIE